MMHFLASLIFMVLCKALLKSILSVCMSLFWGEGGPLFGMILSSAISLMCLNFCFF